MRVQKETWLRFTGCFLAVGWQHFKLLLQVVASHECKEPGETVATHRDHWGTMAWMQGARRGKSLGGVGDMMWYDVYFLFNSCARNRVNHLFLTYSYLILQKSSMLKLGPDSTDTIFPHLHLLFFLLADSQKLVQISSRFPHYHGLNVSLILCTTPVNIFHFGNSIRKVNILAKVNI